MCMNTSGTVSLNDKKGGQYYTPKSIVSLIVEMFEPYKGKRRPSRSGGFFVSSERFIEAHGGGQGMFQFTDRKQSDHF